MIPAIEPIPRAERRPFWSVMIPCHNSGPLLARTLESVLAQDPGPADMQIEVVDDASTDDDPAVVVEKLGAGRVDLFRQPHNVGPAANFTTCVRRSTGRWVHILHSDDVVRPGFYRRYRDLIDRCPDAVMVGGQTITVDALEQYVGVTPPVAVDEHGYVLDPAFTIASMHPLAAVSAVVARATYERIGGFHPALPHSTDWEMWARAAHSGPVAWVDEPFGLYRAHPGSDSSRLHRSTAYLDESLHAMEVIAARFDDPERRRRVRRGARRAIGGYAVAVGLDLVGQGRRRLAVANAARAVRIDPSIRTITHAAEVAGLAITGALRDRLP